MSPFPLASHEARMNFSRDVEVPALEFDPALRVPDVVEKVGREDVLRAKVV